MKIGGNFVVSGDMGTKLYQHGACNPSTVRVQQFWNGEGPRFLPPQLDEIRARGHGARSGGLGEMIIQSSEYPDHNQAWDQYRSQVDYFRAHPETLFIFELGNEPDQHTTDGNAAARRLMDCVWKIRDAEGMGGVGNVFLAVNMPTQGADASFFVPFFAAQPGYQGDILNGTWSPRVLTVHGYGHAILCPNDGADPWRMLREVRARTGKNVKVTEANIGWREVGNPGWPDDPQGAYRAYKLVEAANKINGWYGGAEGIDSFCVYGFGLLGTCNTDPSQPGYQAIGWGDCLEPHGVNERIYELFGGECEAIGRRYASNHCG